MLLDLCVYFDSKDFVYILSKSRQHIEPQTYWLTFRPGLCDNAVCLYPSHCSQFTFSNLLWQSCYSYDSPWNSVYPHLLLLQPIDLEPWKYGWFLLQDYGVVEDFKVNGKLNLSVYQSYYMGWCVHCMQDYVMWLSCYSSFRIEYLGISRPDEGDIAFEITSIW